MRTHDQVGHLSGPEWGGAFPGNTIRGAHEADDRITGREHESPKGTDEAVIDGFGDEGDGIRHTLPRQSVVRQPRGGNANGRLGGERSRERACHQEARAIAHDFGQRRMLEACDRVMNLPDSPVGRCPHDAAVLRRIAVGAARGVHGPYREVSIAKGNHAARRSASIHLGRWIR